MKIAIISDIHGNCSALRRLLSLMENADAIINLGDVANFTAEVNQCYDLLKKKNIINLLGNHEFEALSRSSEQDMLRCGHDFIPSDFGVNEENKQFIKKSFRPYAKLQLDGISYFFCHGVMTKHNKTLLFDYLNEENITEVMEKYAVSVVFCGHLHRPQFIEYERNQIPVLKEIEKTCSLKFREGFLYGFTIGMLSSKKDNPNSLQYGILDTNSREFRYIMEE